MKLKAVLTIVALFIFFGLAGNIFGDGVLIVDPPHPVPEAPAKQPLTVKYHRVSIDIRDQVAVTVIDQVFKNNFDTDLEGDYIFPLPENAAITDFSLWVDGKRTTGEILDKDTAREIYERIVREMRDPGLFEYIGRNMFRARVYPIPGHGESRIELKYTQTLPYDGALIQYSYPLDTERFSPLPIEEVTISAKLQSSIPIKTVYSPSHDVDIRTEKHSAEVGYEANNVKPDNDFLLYYTVSEEDVGLNLLTFRDNDDPGYFLLLLSPGKIETKPLKKDILFVFDTSGSMRGAPLEQAKDALHYCLNGLNEEDRFNVVSFATFVDPFSERLVLANKKNIDEAIEFVGHLRARGGTNIHDALMTALSMFKDTAASRPQMIVFLTDGEPTVGETDSKNIILKLRDMNNMNVRMFVFGVGNDVNTHLLDRISIEHRGVSEYVTPGENIELKVSSFYTKISEPVLSNPHLDFGKIRTLEVYPAVLPDLFKGTQLVLLGRYSGHGTSLVTLRGDIDKSNKHFVYEGKFSEKNLENDFIPRIWATRKIGYLMNEIRLNGEKKELVEEIVLLSKEYGIMTPYTSFLVLENEKEYQRYGIRDDEALLLKDDGERYKRAMKSEVGEEAVASAKDIDSLKSALTRPSPLAETVKHIGSKTFYLKGNQWIDSDYRDGMRVIDIKYLSKKYMDILARNPKLGKYFALGKNLMVVVGNRCYRVKE
ncbi:MAG: VWA domain-containing protein [Spirochaetota bacterium]|nr:MAG: VWA domain-containing protein [Spirochaetota bacterium]